MKRGKSKRNKLKTRIEKERSVANQTAEILERKSGSAHREGLAEGGPYGHAQPRSGVKT